MGHLYRRRGGARKRSKLFGNNEFLPCIFCGKKLTFRTSTLEHIVPISKGGTNDKANLAVSCHRCNSNRGNRSVAEWQDIVSHMELGIDRC